METEKEKKSFFAKRNHQIPVQPSFHMQTSQAERVIETAAPLRVGFISRFLDGIISVSLAALFFGIPLFFTGFTFQGVAFEKELYFYFWLLLAVVSWVSQGVINGEMKIRKTPLDIPLVLFVMAFGVSAALSVDRWHSFWGAFGDPSRGLLNVIALVIAYYLIVSHITSKRITLILASIIAAFFIVAIWLLLAVFGIKFLPTIIESRAPLALFGSVTATLIFCGSMLPLLMSVLTAIRSSLRLGKVLKIILSGVVGLGIILDLFILFVLFPFVSWGAVISGCAFFLLYILAKVVLIEERLAWIPMGVFVLLLAFYMIGSPNIVKNELPVEATPNMSLSWEIAKESIKDRTFFGSGPATYGYAFSLYRPQNYNMQPFNALRFSQGTGLYLESISTLGLVGTIALSILILSFLSVGLFLLAQKKEEKNKILSLGLWSASVVLMISALTVQFNGPILIMSLLVVSLALAVLMKESQTEENYRNLSLQSSPKFALALAFVFLMVSAGVAFTFAFIGKAFWADVVASQAMSAPIDETTTRGLEKMNQAVQSMPRENRYVAYLGQIYLAMATQELAKPEGEKNIDTVKQYIESAHSLTKLSHDMSPNDIASQEIMAQTLERTVALAGVQKNLIESVQKAYEEASALEPHNPVYYIKLGQIKKTLAASAKGEDQKTFLTDAQSLFQKAIDEKPDFAVGYLQLGLAQESLGNIDGAVVSLAKGVALNRRSVDVDELKFNLARLLRVRGKEDDLKLAEVLLKEVVNANEKSLNAYLTLGLVYEQTDRKKEAIESYQKILSLLEGENTGDVRKQVQTFIDNVNAGKSNAKATSNTVSNSEPSVPSSPIAPQPAPVQPAPEAVNTPPVENDPIVSSDQLP